MKNKLFRALMMILANNKGNFMGEAPPADEAPPAEGDNYKYPESLDKEYHGNPTLLKYVNKESGEFDSGNIMKALVHASKSIGADKMLRPNKDFTPDQWKQHHKDSGLPEFEKYDVTNNVGEGISTNDELLAGFKKKAHEMGVLPSQAQGILDFFNTTTIEQAGVSQQAAKTAFEEGITNLRSEWGGAYESRVANSYKALEQFADTEEIAGLKAAGLLDSPVMAKVFDKIAKSFQEDTIFDDETQANHGTTPADLEDKIASFYKPDHAFMNSTHPQNAHYAKEMQRMMEMKVKFKAMARKTEIN